MRTDTFTVDQLIIHEITGRVKDPPAPSRLEMSEVVSPLDGDLTNYFERRIMESLGAGAFPVVVDEGIQSPTPNLVYNQLTDRQADFPQTSKDLARHLFDSQATVSSSPGLLVVVSGAVDVGPCLAILKLQKQEGVRLERTGKRGAQTFSVEHLRRLMLTNETRVFKIALFPAEDLRRVSDIHGVVSDKQRPYAPEKQVADFFLQTFLGCQVRDNPAKTTSTFFHLGERFINQEIPEPHTRTQYHRALLSELTSQERMIDPHKFADQHLPEADRGRFLDYIREHQGPTRPFDKDDELIRSRLREREYVLESGLKVRGPADAWDKHVEESQGDDDTLELLISDRLKSVRGR